MREGDKPEATDLLVKKDALAETKLVRLDPGMLDDGQIRLQVDLFSLTANNVTYGSAGDFLKYWNFYPSGEEGWGRVPVWGFASVVESRSPAAAVGERVYGYLPMSETFVLTPGARKHGAFAETAAHRAGLAPVYNTYVLDEGRSALHAGDRGTAGAVPPAVHDVFPDRRLCRGCGVFRRQAGRVLQRFSQDGVCSGAAAESAGRCKGGGADVDRECRLYERPRILR